MLAPDLGCGYKSEAQRILTLRFRPQQMHKTQALIPITSRLMLTNRPRIIEFSIQRHLLLASGFGPWAKEGALLSYGPDTDASTRRAAAYVDKILRGTRPDELPIEQSTKFQLVINGKTAKSLGLNIPSTLLALKTSMDITVSPINRSRSGNGKTNTPGNINRSRRGAISSAFLALVGGKLGWAPKSDSASLRSLAALTRAGREASKGEDDG